MKKSIFVVACVAGVAAGLARAQQFQDQTATRLPAQAVWSEEVDAGDVDGDGDLDLVYAKGNGFSAAGTPQQNTLLINVGGGVYVDQTSTRLPPFLDNSKDVDFVDVDGDGDLDLVVANGFNQQPRLYLNDGSGVFTDATATHFPTITLNSFSSSAADVDADGDLDLAFTDSGASTFGGAGGLARLFINDGTGHFTDETATRMPSTTVVGAVDADFADVDGDFDLDLFVVSRDGTPSKLYLNDGTGVFTTSATPLPPDGTGTYEYEIGDVDGDLDADVFVVGISGLTEGTFVNDGSGVFTTGVGAVVGNLSSDDNDAALGDLDDDGDLDCIVGALSTSERVFFNNGSGTFTYAAGSITAFVDSSLDGELADVDGDGDLDYLSAVGESGAFQNRLYINTSATAADTHPPTFRLPPLSSTTAFGNIVVRVGVMDVMTTDGDPRYGSVVLNWTVSGVPGSAPMTWAGRDLFQAVIPGVPFGAPVVLSATCVDRAGNIGTSSNLSFTPAGFPPSTLTVTTTGVGDCTVAISAPALPFAEEFVVVSAYTTAPVGTGPFVGLGLDAFLFLQLPIGTPPLHHVLDGFGQISTTFPAGSVPIGATFDARGILLPPLGIPQLTNIVRRTF
jgi:hypothetical protein